MKKKEILIIFVLTILATAGSWFYIERIGTHCRGLDLVYHGFPFQFYIEYRYNPARTSGLPCGLWTQPPVLRVFLIDLLFWFLVLAMGWWLIKKLNVGNEG